LILDYDSLEPKERYHIITQSVIPRAIAWIVTEARGLINIAPFSYFTPLSSNPPTLIVSIGHKVDGTPKDTLKNIRDTKRCTICIPKREHLEQLQKSAEPLDKWLSEAKEFGIPTRRVFDSFPPIVENVSLAFACEFYQEVDLGGSRTVPIILEIKKQYIEDRVISDLREFKIINLALGRGGGDYLIDCRKIDAPKI
jgi:flavin reductase (DIM6/NTAB) family NADH-FMN oxidoreductase RutF